MWLCLMIADQQEEVRVFHIPVLFKDISKYKYIINNYIEIIKYLPIVNGSKLH